MTDEMLSDDRPDHDGDPGTAKRRRRRRILRRVVCAVLLVVVGAGGVLFWLIRSEPAHWTRHQQFLQSTSPEELKSIARKIDRQLEGALGDKRIHMTIEEANVWITEKTDEWLKYRDYEMPSQISRPMIALDGGQLLLSFGLNVSGFSQVFTAGFDLKFLENGNALLQLRNVTAGRLPLPADGIGDYIRSKVPDNATARRAAGWLDKLDGVEFKPALKHGKQRKVCVVDYDVAEDGITLTVQVEKRPGYGQPKQLQTQVATAEE